MTEKEKMYQNRPYFDNDELNRQYYKCQKLLHKFNKCKQTQKKQRGHIIKKILGNELKTPEERLPYHIAFYIREMQGWI